MGTDRFCDFIMDPALLQTNIHEPVGTNEMAYDGKQMTLDTGLSDQRERRNITKISHNISGQRSGLPKRKSFSEAVTDLNRPGFSQKASQPLARRPSLDGTFRKPRVFRVPVKQTLAQLLERESRGNGQITVEDNGPKVLKLLLTSGRGSEIRGTYMLSNLLQELTIADGLGRQIIMLDEARLYENPVDRLSRLIKTTFWDSLTRKIDDSNIQDVALDIKVSDGQPRIYIPPGAPEQYDYFTQLSRERPDLHLDVRMLPESDEINGEFIRDLNTAPGLLALAMEERVDQLTGRKQLQGLPYVVPGGRFNELYGWDSYMIALGLLSSRRIDLAQAMVTHFCFCIKNYGRIFNANRTYYLGRSQPPFLTDMALRVYEKIKHEPGSLDFLKIAIQAAIKEYHGVWTSRPRLDPLTGLSRYRPVDGFGVPPETEPEHFVQKLKPYAKRYGLTHEDFVSRYNSGEIKDPDLDEYFLHDRAVRESGHDSSYRLEGVAADLATVDLNSLLYKYEQDIAFALKTYFDDNLEMPIDWCAKGKIPGHEQTHDWVRRAKNRRALMNRYLWDESKGMYFDYNTATRQRTNYESATTLYTLWSGVASPRKALKLVQNALPKLEAIGGLLSGSKASRGDVGIERPPRQWDYPYGWAPHQILAWKGLQQYGYIEDSQRLAYKWLYMVTKAFYDFNGIVVEKYNVTAQIDPHKVDAEYGNQGSDFMGVAKEGFGWVNASYVIGLELIDTHMRRALGTLTPWVTLHRMTEQDLVDRIAQYEKQEEYGA